MDKEIIGLVAAYLVVEITKFLVKNLKTKQTSQVGAIERDRIADLWKWSLKVQPQDIHSQNEKILDLMRTMTTIQQQQTDLIERLVDGVSSRVKQMR